MNTKETAFEFHLNCFPLCLSLSLHDLLHSILRLTNKRKEILARKMEGDAEGGAAPLPILLEIPAEEMTAPRDETKAVFQGREEARSAAEETRSETVRQLELITDATVDAWRQSMPNLPQFAVPALSGPTR